MKHTKYELELMIEDLDSLVEIARKQCCIAPWLGLADSAMDIRKMLKKKIKKIKKTKQMEQN